jgi:hypothetical protein
MIGFNFQLLTDLSSFWFLSWNIILLTWEGGGDSRYFCILIGGSRAFFGTQLFSLLNSEDSARRVR